MAVKFTPSQQSVIDTRDRNILVSAAAGSGKTAVLVERIIQKICDENRPVDIDRLLIVTFTHAAAAQMKERINKAITKKLEDNPDNEHLQRQAALIHNAQITTIDSFCLFVIRNNFNAIGLDPGFRIADEAEVKMIKADVIKAILEKKFEKRDERFLKFVECYSTRADEKKIEAAVESLYNFSTSYPFPEDWLRERLLDYQVEDELDLLSKEWYKKVIEYKDTIIADSIGKIRKAKEIISVESGLEVYKENFDADEELLTKFYAYKTYADCHDYIRKDAFTKLKSCRSKDVDEANKKTVTTLRDEVKASVEDLSKKLFMFSLEDMIEDMHSCQEMVEELIELTLEYKAGIDEVKKDKNILDFSDMEHFALQILLEKDENGNLITRETAKELQDYFEEIMIDEYQDSNEVQELLLKSISKEENGSFNRFMVGDVKQSIYKFRLARPEIFMEKYDTYVTDLNTKDKVRIDLSMNFRSREEITGITNYICGQIMQKSVGNVEYDTAAELNHGATDMEFEGNENPYETELMLVSTESETEDLEDEQALTDAAELEANMVADRINQLVGRFMVYDEGKQRPAMYSDIVLLFRSPKGVSETFRKVLMSKGIPVHLISKTGYFETLEIQNVINFLRVLDNPSLDIPFLATMKLPFFDFTNEEIATIKCTGEGKCLYHQVRAYLLNEEKNEELQKKAELLLDTIDMYRRKMAYTPIKELIGEILDYTGYLSYVTALPGGLQRRANVELLLEKAGDFEKTSFYGLFHFIRYIETVKEREVDFGEANTLDENANVVRIMTIHNSKGLEFPICFVCNLSKQFNMMDVRNSIITDVGLGIGVEYINPDLRIKRKTCRKNLVALKMQEDTLGEELRVLYVALTRAKEKLILTGVVKDFDKTMESYSIYNMDSNQKLPYSFIMSAKNYLSLILASVMRHPAMKEVFKERGYNYISNTLPYMDAPLKIINWSLQDSLKHEIIDEGVKSILEEELKNPKKYANEELAKKIEQALLFSYPHTDLEGLTVKTTVSDLKKAGYEEAVEAAQELYTEDTTTIKVTDKPEDVIEENTGYIPAFMREKQEVLGTQYGTAVHKIMELLSFSEDYLSDSFSEETHKRFYGKIKNEIQSWIDNNMVDEAEVSCANIWKIAEFFKCDLAKRMVLANKRGELYKEQPFVIGIAANQMKEHLSEKETVLVQGVIDGFFYEDGKIILMDYKTDRVKAPKDLVQRYKTQLDYYEKALTQITNKKVLERKIYAFGLGMEIDV